MSDSSSPMPEAGERLIAAATDPLRANAEMQVAGERLLSEAIARSGGAEGDEILKAADRLEGSNKNGRPGWSRVLGHVAAWCLYAALLLTGIMYWVSVKPTLLDIQSLGGLGSMSPLGPAGKEVEPEWKRELSAEQRLRLFGDVSQTSKARRWKPLWDLDPTRPEFFAEYASEYIREHKDVPPDFLKIGEEIDPGNAWYPLMAFAMEAGKAIESIPRSEEEKAAKVPAKYVLKDPQGLERAKLLLRQAVAMPRLDTRQRELLAARVRLLPHDNDWPHSMQGVAYMAGEGGRLLPLREVIGMLRVECERIQESGDAEAMRALIREWEALAKLLVTTPECSLIDALVKQAVLRGGFSATAKAARKMNLEEAGRLEGIDQRLKEYRDKIQAAKGGYQDFKKRAGALAGLSLPTVQKQVLKPPGITDEELKPARVAEHEFITKIALGAWSASLGMIALAVFLYRFRGGALRRILAGQMSQLLDRKDRMWIMGAGVIAPLAAGWLLLRLPGTGAREWSLIAIEFAAPMMVILLGVWLTIPLPVLIARWRLRKKAGFAGLAWKREWIPWLLVAWMLLAMPLAGWALLPWNLKPPVAMAYVALSSLAQGWMIAVGLRGLLSKQEYLLKRVTLSRVVYPAYLLAGILTGAMAMLSHQLEKRAIRADQLTGISAEKPSMSIYEYEITQVMGRELREVIETED
ncbi:MFS transporter [Luteolibacter sp. GHJ8]|uniref:MFS transporter n=1 Tax=Luteolibacter rhizosphaerae TaxID=2989719 RepID=A0ABT3G5D3_9BACT|nr:MFS transporter [Luteolibacter rhizosphaerae]MCW1914867.1 MFS transporter [Luteolibacter rhizosphaerae]